MARLSFFKPLLLRLFLGSLPAFIGVTPVHANSLPERISQQLKRYGIAHSAVSIDVREAATNKTVLSMNSDQPRNPASVIKLLTTLSALEILGPDYTWKTRFLLDGSLQDDTLNGNLVFQGGGDPFLTVDRLWHQVLSIRQRGIRHITGKLIIDNALFSLSPHDPAAFDKQPARLYNVGADAALVNFSATRFVVHPVGNGISVSADPPMYGLKIVNKLESARGKCISKNSGWHYAVDRSAEQITVTFTGSYRSRCGQHSIARAFIDNNDYTYRLFKYLWQQSDGKLEGGYAVAKSPDDAIELLTYPSEPLADIITSINKYSNNVMTRNLFLSIDAQKADEPATLEGARAMLANWLVVNGLSTPGLFVDNGSGLSRKTRISSRSLADLLHHGWNSNYRPEFLSSLSLTALDGTMRKRLHDSGLQGRARIKTGLIKGVRSMAGYVNSRNNRQYIVSMMIETGKVNYWNGNEIQDALLKWIYARE